MDKWLLMFFVGAILALFLPIVPALFYIVLLLALVVALFIAKKYVFTGLLLGCCWILWQGFHYQTMLTVNKLAKSELHAKSHIIEAEVLTLHTAKQGFKFPQGASKNSSKKNALLRFNVKVVRFDYQTLKQPFIIRLSWKNANLFIQQGNYVRLHVRLKPAHGLANTGSFNYQLWLRAQQIVATGYVLNGKNKNKSKSENKNENQITRNILSFRQQQLNRLTKILPQHSLSPLLIALALGEKRYITPAQWQVLTATGTQHLIAISGLHLGLVATSIFLLVLLVVRIIPLPHWPLSLLFTTRINNQLSQQNVNFYAIAVSLLVTFIYALLAGFAIPTLRALFMLNLYWLARLLAIKVSLQRWLLLVVFFVLITSPMSVLSASFWLSFYAVLVIFLLLWRCHSWLSITMPVDKKTSYFKQLKRKIIVFIKGLFVLQLGLSLFLLPITILFYQKISIVAFAANIIAVPWMSFTAIPLSLFAILIMPFSESLALTLFNLCLQSLDVLWQWLTFLAQQPWSLYSLSLLQSSFIIVLILLLALVFFLNISLRYCFYGVPILLALFVNFLWGDEADWQVNVFDVGHGLAVVIEKNHHVIIYDVGAQYSSGFNISDAVLLPYLQQRGIKHIDKVFISHNDNDHVGALTALVQKIPIDELIYNQQFKAPLRVSYSQDRIKISQSACLQGQNAQWQGLRIQQLWPTRQVAENNDDSCVIKISDAKQSVLLTGDISKKVEKRLVEGALTKQTLTADVLIAPHHGSKSASSSTFLQAVSPQYAIFSSGYLNRWHMPVRSVVMNYRKLGIETLNTAENGMINVQISTDQLSLSTYRDDLFPYWFAN